MSRRQRTVHLIVWLLLGPALVALLLLGAAERSRRAEALAEPPSGSAGAGPAAPESPR